MPIGSLEKEPEQPQLRLCKDCLHYREVAGKYTCNMDFVIDLVHGGTKKYECGIARGDNGPCGIEGAFWEEKI